MTAARRTGLAICAVVALGALMAPALAPNPPSRQHADLAYAPPMPPRLTHDGRPARPFVYPLELTHRLERRFTEDRDRQAVIRFFSGGRMVSTDDATPWLFFGGDPLGRDVFARVLAGSRLSLGVSGVAVVLTLALGTLAGAVAGFHGGRVERIIATVADFVIVLPVLYVVVTLRAAMPLYLEPATVFWTMAGVMALASWPLPARGVRAIVALERTKAYAESAYAMGAGPLRILLRHLLPATAGHVAIQGLLLFPAFVFAEATLSYLGLGFAEPQASWGVMLQDASRVAAITEAPWLLAPAGAIVITVTGIHLAMGETDVWRDGTDVLRAGRGLGLGTEART